MEEDADDDIYVDLPNFRYDKTLDELNASIAKLEDENRILQTKLKQVAEEKEVLEVNCTVLSTNISSLLKTAKLEIQRKERTITDLREQLNKVMPAKSQYGLKRRRETIVSPSPRKRPRFSPRKVHTKTAESRVSITAHKRVSTRTSRSTSKSSRHHDKSVHEDRRPSRDEEARQRCDSGKENAPAEDKEASKDSPVGEKKASKDSPVDQLALAEISKEPAPAIPAPSLSAITVPSVLAIQAPSLPALECPTLFSARMYKRLYGRDRVTTTSPAPKNSTEITEMVPTAIINQGMQSSEPPEKERTSDNLGSSDRFSKSIDHKSVDESDVSRTQSLCRRIKPFVSSYPVPPPCIVASQSVTNVVPLPSKGSEPLPEKSEPPAQQPVEPVLAVLPSEKTDSSVPVNRECPSVKSRMPGLLSMCKPRIQSPAVRPIQQFAALETTPGKEPEKNLIVESPKPSADTNESKRKENSKLVDNKPSPDRHLKVPRLPGSVKGRTVRKVFAPISQQRNCPSPTANDHFDCSKTFNDEIPSAKTVPRTSELRVRVDDSRLNEVKKQSLAEAVFGSPVKWADDSSDSPIAEGHANSRKTIIYSVFGSPLKSVDSNSSDHPFTVPPGAYEDSCWTNTTLEKVPSKSSSDGSVQNLSQQSLEPVSAADNKPMDTFLEPFGVDKSTETSIFPPPLRSVIKKHKSIFSPLKDSRLSVPNGLSDEPSRSNTGMFFPFPRPKYEDTVLGQFDDTVQFVSALAKVDTRISPLSTPVKSGEESNSPPQSVIVKNNPTSFKEVFQKNIQSEGVLGKPADSDYVGPKAAENLSSTGPSCSSTDQQHEYGKQLICDGNPQRQEIVMPPTITVTPPKIDNLRLIHRPNFASSTIFEGKSGVKSWFPNAPAKMVIPRKSPRLVSNFSRSASPKGIDVSVGARVAINDAFLIDQEERVRRWELDHMYENTIRSASGSPVKSVNRSPTRKKVDSSGNVSPSKRSKKQASPSKSPRRFEFRKSLGSEPSPQISGAAALHPDALSGGSTVVNLNLTSGSDNQIDTDKTTGDLRRIPAEVIKSVLDTKPKLMHMLSAIIKQTKHAELGKDALAVNNVANADAANNGSMGEYAQKTPICSGLETPSTSALTDEALAVTDLGPTKPCLRETEDICPKTAIPAQSQSEATSKAAQLTVQPDSRLSVEQTLVSKKGNSISKLTDPAPTVPSDPSSIANEGKSSPNPKSSSPHRKRYRILNRHRIRSSSSAGPIIPPGPTELSDHRDPPEVVRTEHVEAPVKVSKTTSKYDSIISRVKPSTPLHKTVAARISSSMISSSPSSRPYLKITAPVQSSKISNFKRSSALKPTSQRIEIQIQGSKDAEVQIAPPSPKLEDTANVQTPEPSSVFALPRLVRRRSIPNLSVCTKNEVQNVTHDRIVPTSEKKVDNLERVVAPDIVHLSVEPTENSPDKWKMHEIDFRPADGKPFSLLQKFIEVNGIPAPPRPVDSNAVTNSIPSSAKITRGTEPGSNFEPSACSTLVVKCSEKGVLQEQTDAQQLPIANGDKQLNGNYRFPPKSPFRSPARKTILLDTPMRMELPAKGAKRRNWSGESGGGETPRRGNVQDGTETSEESASSRKLAKKHVSPQSESGELDRKLRDMKRAASPDRRNRFRSSGYPGCYASPEKERRSRYEKCDAHPKSQRKKSWSDHNDSPDRSPAGSYDQRKSSGKTHSREKASTSSGSVSGQSSPESAGRISNAKSYQRNNSRSNLHHSPELSRARKSDRKEVSDTTHRREKASTSSESAGRTSNAKSNQQSKSQSTRHDSPERSAARKPDLRELSDKTSSVSTDRRSRHSSLEPAGKISNGKSYQHSNSRSNHHHHHSPVRSPARKPDIREMSDKTHQREKVSTCSESSDRISRLSSSESGGRTSTAKSNQRSKSRSNRHDSPERSTARKPDIRELSDKTSTESADRRSRHLSPEPAGKISKITSSKPAPGDGRSKHSSSVPVLESKSAQSKTPLKSGTTATAPASVQLTPPKIIKLNRRPANFGASTTQPTKVVLSLGKRPAMFSPT